MRPRGMRVAPGVGTLSGDAPEDEREAGSFIEARASSK